MFNFWSSGHTSEHVVSHEIYRVIKFMQKLKSFKMFSYLGIVYRIKGTSHTRYYFAKIINGCHGNQGNIPKIKLFYHNFHFGCHWRKNGLGDPPFSLHIFKPYDLDRK